MLDTKSECTILSSNNEEVKAAIIALETQALELWNNGNPDGFLALSSDDVVYFEPELKLEGKRALEDYYNSIRGMIKVESYQMIKPVVQLSSEVAVLTYNLDSQSNGMIFKWNCTEVYRLDLSNQWKIIHTHWSLIQSNQ